ncbi:MAG: hypothetical protein AB1750_04925 [Chloroflexota bacterium]
MKRYAFIATFLVLSVLLAGCLQIFVPAPTATLPPTAIPPATLAPTQTLQVLLPTDTQLAPVCAVDPLLAACAVPQVEERAKYCAEKLPYVQFAMAPGVTFEPLDPALRCTDEGIRGGEQVITCTGQPLIAYDLKICNAACNPSALTVDPSKCAEGFGYSPEAGCCWPLPTDDQGCVIVKVNVGACR